MTSKTSMESKKVLKENISKAFPDIDCASVFLGQSPKAIEIKMKINNWDFNLQASVQQRKP